MAIIEDVPGIAVSIVVAGENLQEYQDDDEEDTQSKSSSTYVEAKSGAKFGVAIRFNAATFPHPNAYVRFQLLLDGRFVVSKICSPKQIGAQRPVIMDTVTFVLKDRDVVQDFSFAELYIAEGDADVNLLGKLGHLGTITVKAYRVRYIDAPAQPPVKHPNMLPESLLQKDEIPEKNLKGRAVSHQAKLRVTEEILHRSNDTKNESARRLVVPIENSPFATFKFKYRSRHALQALLILPRTPSPVPPKDRPEIDSTPDEANQLMTKQREKHTEKAKPVKVKMEFKREREGDEREEDDHDDDEVEVVEGPAQKTESTGVVDLCDDE